jgi:hypothetical protein
MKNYLRIFVTTTTLFMGASSAWAQNTPNPIPTLSDEWRFSVTPYVWTPSLNSTLYLNNSPIGRADLSTSSILSDLNTAAMLSGEAHKGKWGIMGDLIYVEIINQGAKVIGQTDVGSTATVKNTIFTAAVTYTFAHTQDLYADALVGARLLSTSANLNVRAQGYPNETLSNTTTTTDPIIGFKGRFRLGDGTWYVPFYADFGGGGGSTNITWQALIGVGKAFDWGDVTLGYRALYYDMKSGATLQKTTMAGPALGLTINF